jgi:hypothetical protein
MPRIAARALYLLPALGLVATATAAAQQEQTQQADNQQITLNVKAPEEGESFACHIPVSVSHPKALDLETMTVVAKAYHGNIELASTGVHTGNRPIIGDVDARQVEYEPIPLQFDLTEQDCERITGLGIAFASCTYKDGTPENCIDRLRFEPERAGEVAFFVGEPMPPAR